MNTPILVALCGWPTSGKSEVQKVLERNFGIVAFDDATLIRRHCRELFGLSETDVTTQEGKRRETLIEGVSWQNRKILGEYANMLERLFGPLTVPNWAIRAALEHWHDTPQRNHTGYSFGSVRRNQGVAYRSANGLVVEIKRPGIEFSGNDFDTYETSNLTHSFVNETETLEDLEEAVIAFFEQIIREQLRFSQAA